MGHLHLLILAAGLIGGLTAILFVAIVDARVRFMSAEFDAVKADYEAFKAEVQTDVKQLQDKVTALQTQIANAPSDTAALKALADEIAKDTADLHASVNPPAPTPPPAA